jgi:phosphatidylglycerophosphatase A
MTARTDAPAPPSTSNQKPRFALFVATAAGLGYAPKAPGTFGSLAGIALAISPLWFGLLIVRLFMLATGSDSVFVKWSYRFLDPYLLFQILIAVTVAWLGVWASSRAARYWGLKDPQRVVIDEVSGQHLALLIGGTLPTLTHVAPKWSSAPLAMLSAHSSLGWQYLLAGFILFRLFDIWKPFPARQAESLPGGWGIMADDWIAGLYAAIGLWLIRSAGL